MAKYLLLKHYRGGPAPLWTGRRSTGGRRTRSTRTCSPKPPDQRPASPNAITSRDRRHGSMRNSAVEQRDARHSPPRLGFGIW